MEMVRSLEPTRDLDSCTSEEEEEEDGSLSSHYKMKMHRSLEPTRYHDGASKLEAFRQHLRSCTFRRPCGDPCRWHGFNISDSDDQRMYMEENYKQNQSKLAHNLRMINKNRLMSGYNPRTKYSSEKQSGTEDDEDILSKLMKGGGDAKDEPVVLEKLIKEKPDRVLKLSDVILVHPNLGHEEANIGTLEAHVNGLLYTSSSFHQHCLFRNIKASFFHLAFNAFDSSPPLLHFHLDTEINVGGKKTKDILFYLVITSDEAEKEKQEKIEDRNKDLKIFVSCLPHMWGSIDACVNIGPIEEMEEKDAFLGVLASQGPAIFYPALFSIVGHVKTPFGLSFVVVDAEDIEIVNLAIYHPLPQFILMTVVCKDFKVDSVLEITIPLENLTVIKDWFYRTGVKYYENQVQGFKSLVKEIAEDFQTFLECGGWEQYKLEDNATVRDYYCMEWEEFPVNFDTATNQGERLSGYTSESSCSENYSESDSEEE